MTSRPTSIYLDEETREALGRLSAATGHNHSQVMRNLIRAADGNREARMIELVGELQALLRGKPRSGGHP